MYTYTCTEYICSLHSLLTFIFDNDEDDMCSVEFVSTVDVLVLQGYCTVILS